MFNVIHLGREGAPTELRRRLSVIAEAALPFLLERVLAPPPHSPDSVGWAESGRDEPGCARLGG